MSNGAEGLPWKMEEDKSVLHTYSESLSYQWGRPGKKADHRQRNEQTHVIYSSATSPPASASFPRSHTPRSRLLLTS